MCMPDADDSAPGRHHTRRDHVRHEQSTHADPAPSGSNQLSVQKEPGRDQSRYIARSCLVDRALMSSILSTWLILVLVRFSRRLCTIGG